MEDPSDRVTARTSVTPVPDDEQPTTGSSPDGIVPPPGPAVLSRSDLRRERTKKTRARWYVLGVVVALLLGVGVAALVTHSDKTAAKAPVITATTAAPAPLATCPLTGTPAPGGTVPNRPALAVKIGNYSGDRPSTGLNQADVVFEEPVEGSYTRLVAVFHCQGAPLVGDLRSAREPDVAILSQLSDPLFVHAGGITPVLGLLAAGPLQDENVLAAASAVVTHPSGRYAPYSTFTSTAAVWALHPAEVTPPSPLFSYAATLPAGSVVGSGQSVHIPFSSDADVTWTWDPSSARYLRSYSGTPDKLLDGSQTATANVIVLTVATFLGPWVENSQGAHEVEVTAVGSGPLVVLRGGVAITGTWSRTSLTRPATLATAGGQPITLQPGNTWEELVPQGIPVTTTAAPTAAPATTVPGSTGQHPATTRP